MTHDTTWFRSEGIAPVVQTYEQRQSYWTRKRAFDVVVASLLLFILIPVMALIAFLITLETPGPAIFRQKRVGLRRRTQGGQVTYEIGTFTINKFRTMYQGNDSTVHRQFVRTFGSQRRAEHGRSYAS